MKTFEDIQLAISNLSGNDRSRIIDGIMKRAEPGAWAVREAVPIYGISSEMAAIQSAIENLSPEELGELHHWLQLVETETPEMLAAIDEGLRSLEENGGIEFTQEELLAKVRQWAGVSS